MIYAGIGSRKTPDNILILMEHIGSFLSSYNWILRSGGASGADTAFEKRVSEDLKEIYLPWSGFMGNYNLASSIPVWAYETVDKFHPNPNALTKTIKKLMARNGMQILGKDGKTPANLVICWTPNGGIEGGTGQAMRIAKHYGIPILNLRNDIPEMNINWFESLAKKHNSVSGRVKI